MFNKAECNIVNILNKILQNVWKKKASGEKQNALSTLKKGLKQKKKKYEELSKDYSNSEKICSGFRMNQKYWGNVFDEYCHINDIFYYSTIQSWK